ncbi:glycosyltransferase family 4 protein [Orenia marismortui]|uniref:Glycosyltransferase involved in cell wall biosynthesis n=1 Tax=Orenia marismortui TaxID=46469 RepID=A0A4V3GWU4_9FIRM|nr:glycosyltransferase family 1 protein [Orenia marismortui]TDX45309.1 glycosyltransferase involved in cell wall biosynthesis [Orenia marismortui]
MRIAIFTDTFLPQVNGVTKTLAKLKEHLEKEGIDYLIFAPDDPEADSLNFEENIQRMLSFRFFLYPECRLSVPNYFKIKNKLNEYQPNLIHIVTPFNLGLCGLKYATSYDIPLISSYHTNFTHYLDYYNLHFLEKPIWTFFRWFHSHSTINLCPSQSSLEELSNNGIKNLEIWDRGINSKLYSPQYRDEDLRESYELGDKITLLYVGRLAPEKNLNLLIESMKIINQKYQDQVRLLITGDGPLLDKLKSEAPSNVIFTGYLKGHDLSKIYASADIFAFPSITETYGNVILEAMASGLAVVSFLEGGVRENLEDGYNGLACVEVTPESFARNLEKVIINKKLREELADNAYNYAINKSWDKVFERLINNYQEVINYGSREVFISA